MKILKTFPLTRSRNGEDSQLLWPLISSHGVMVCHKCQLLPPSDVRQLCGCSHLASDCSPPKRMSFRCFQIHALTQSHFLLKRKKKEEEEERDDGPCDTKKRKERDDGSCETMLVWTRLNGQEQPK
jgi:hypothetical protein